MASRAARAAAVRRARVDDDIVMEEEEDAQPSIKPQKPQAKASNTSAKSSQNDADGGDRGGSSDSDDSQQDEDSPRRSSSSKKRKERDEPSLDGLGIEEGDDDEADEQQGTATSESDVGVIESITLVNFLCHGNLEVKLSPRVNWITGRNGSGKSAILTAITVGLGGKIRFTGRGSSLSAAIKQGAHSAKIAIRLKNAGPDAYKPQVYGNSIIVERSITKTSSTYTLKSADGRTIAKTAAELRAIVEHFDIQVDNECAVLMQETSKRFLHHDSPNRKYQLFLKATQLEKMKTDLVSSKQNITKMRRELEGNGSRLPELEQRYNQLQEQYQQMKALEQSKEKLKQLKIRLAWSVVAQMERELTALEDKVETTASSRTKNAAMLADAEKDIKTAEEKQRARIAETDAIAAKAQAIKNEQARLMQMKDANAKERARRNQRIENAKRAVQAIEKRLAAAKKQLEEARQKQAQDTQTEMDSRQQEINAVQKQISNLREELNSLQSNQQGHQQRIAEKSEEVRQATNITAGIQREYDKLARHKQQLEQSKKDPDILFGGQAIQRIQNAIRSVAGKFRAPPIGPLGKYLSLVDDKYAVAVETAVGGLFNLWVVGSREDEILFNRTLVNAGIRENELPPVMVTSFISSDLDYSDGTVRGNYTTLLSVIKSTNPTCTKVLVDQQKIEQKIVVSTRDDALRILKQENPRNLKEIYLISDGTRAFMSAGQLVETTGRLRQPRLVSDQSAAIRSLTEQMKKIDQDYKAQQQQQQALQQSLEALRRDGLAQSSAARIAQLNRSIAQQEVILRELNSQRPPAPPNDDDISEFEEAVQALSADMQEKQRELHAVENEASQAHSGLGDLQSQIEAKEAEIKKVMAEISAHQTDVESATSVVKKIELAITRIREVQAKVDEEYRNLTETTARKQSSIREASEKATRVGPRPDDEIKESYTQLEAKIRSLQAAVDEQQRNAGETTIEQVQADMNSAQRAFLRLKVIITKLELNLTRLENLVQARTKKWAQFRRSISRRTAALFSTYLTQKGFEGGLDFDHETQELHIRVNPDQSNGAGAGSTSTLSGGERSFSTVSLMLSLWDSMEVPFRAMDEFDVFMDAGNRRVAIELLNKVGREKAHRQHIFLTPNPMPTMDGVNVLALEPPRE